MTMERSSCGSEVVVMDDRIQQVVDRSQPAISNLNVTKSSRVHIGPKFVSVTQNVDKTEVVKGRILGLELVWPMNPKRLRCSIAVFVCWAFVVASVLTFFIFYFALSKQPSRLILDLPFHRYIWDVAKSTTKVERLSCIAAMVILLAVICILLVVYFTVIAKQKGKPLDAAPHEWFITKEMWLGQKRNYTDTTDAYNPLKLVIISHTVSSECTVFINCAAEMRTQQRYAISTGSSDIAYNFLIGNDGRVYEGRGWNIAGAHTLGYNRCSLGVGFVGDYREGLPSYSKVSKLQEERAQMLFELGVKLGHLDPHYLVVGAMDIKSTESPGANLYKAMQKWSHYDLQHVYKNRTCDQIQQMESNNFSITTTPATK